MRQIELAYGHGSFSFGFDEQCVEVLSNPTPSETPLSDVEIGAALDAPFDSPPIEEMVNASDSVLLVVSDATRLTASAQILNLLVRRLVQNAIPPSNIAVIFATGIHRPVTAQESAGLLTPFISQRLRTINHDAYDPANLSLVGTTRRGTPVELNRVLQEFSCVIITGGIGFHYFAGFTGGRKSICPGLASAQTIQATHMLALDLELGGRRSGVGTGLLKGNLVHEECDEIAAMINPAFSINSRVDERGRAVKIYAGHWRTAHRAGCDDYLSRNSVGITSKRRVVIASCGGWPYDINLIQAHKALDMAAHACETGGTIILLAECAEGLGRNDFLKWFANKSSGELEARLREEYEVNGQTAWALLNKSESFNVHLISALRQEDVKRMGMTPAASLEEALAGADLSEGGYILLRGASVLPIIVGENGRNLINVDLHQWPQ
ncbi:MAG TPA: nickel-dependent lactate racemase [Pyrinomonadaceae bacterium]|nr:nickel-dependent lactate racemase [Pyrinomonadaceae bacterium]